MNKHFADTIAAVATAPGPGAVGIVRISGPEALAVALCLCAAPEGGLRDRRARLVELRAPGGEPIDSGLLIYMKGPGSYTGEDVVELQCHGGPLVLREVLSAAVEAGARPALAGEFTKRAFLNGKLDLAQAEAVCDLIGAETRLSLSSARGRLEGAFSKRVRALKAPLVELLARLEAELDFSEDEIDAVAAGEAVAALKEASGGLGRMLEGFDEGRAMRQGVRALILGRPNAGKSSLLNALLGEERAIVASVPGTTRDVIEETLSVLGLPVRLMDTAGLREPGDEVEAAGVRLARKRVDKADLVLYVVDLAAALFDEDAANLAALAGTNAKVIVVANKADLGRGSEQAREAFAGFQVAAVSALTGEGMERLKGAIFSAATGRERGLCPTPPGELVATARHRDCLARSLEAVERAAGALRQALPRELVAADLRASVDALGDITGETTTEDILDRIFSSFCIGK